MTNPAPSWTTPNPSVHYAPGSSLNTPAFTPQQIEAIGQQLVLGFLRWVVQALIGVVTGQNLSGVLAQLSSWSNTLQSDINGAATDVQQAIDNVVQLFGGSGTNNPVSQILSQGKDAINQLVNSLQGLSTGNPFGDFANALQAIPGLNIAGQLRPATGVVLAGAHIVDINPELLWAPGFDTAASVSARAPQITWDGTTGRTNPGSLLIQPDGAYLYSDVGNPIPVTPGEQLAMSIWAKWAGLVYTGTNPIRLEVLQYKFAGMQVPQRVSSVVLAEFTNPPASQSVWQQLSQTFTVPIDGSVDTVFLRPLVDAIATAGQVWFDDGSVKKVNTIPSNLLSGVPASAINGIQGIEDIGSTIQNTWDNLATTLANALNLSGVSSSGNPLSTVTQAVQSTAHVTVNAMTLAQNATNTLGIQDNRAVSAGLEETVESNMSLQSLGSGSAPSTVTATQSASAGGFLRASQAKTLGFHQWWGYYSGTVTAFYLNFAKMDSSGNITPLFSSGDLHTNLSTTGQWNVYTFPYADEIPVNPGDVILVEYQVVGSGTVYIAGLGQSWQTNHPSANTKQTGFTRNTGSSGPTALSSGITYTGNTPYVGLGVSNIPPNYQPPVTSTYTAAGQYTFTLPPWMVAGNKLDLAGVGGGGAGQGEQGYSGGQGGSAGSWNVGTLVVGTDIAPGGTITVTVGAGGPQQIQYFTAGLPGTATTFQWTDPGGTQHTLTCPGGAGGSGIPTSQYGASPGNETYNGVIYYGGGTANESFAGSAPGGGGGGAAPYSFGGAGADGQAWIRAYQS
ncbi:glycine-rich domain-containing protein [Mycobacterium branderi]|uniref:Glycine-rich domain-containing protein n=1 Tax=Mycobacterium branderi TaxID=43348 RepID=A0A7I7VX00_9MYCO|nr:hypothetical protein [Mycobacterium branderi]MCV7232755.1 hypothetical protein [Mycobacterium branderi]ORA40895.1 hypothetical protein BST20_01735 [Mycobacterium branderi]BBZ09854.1 hypothetical protein MBRA_00490 [Mycobacterium branderi]